MTLALALSIFAFLTIVVIVFAFGAASVAPSSVLGSRLREIGWQRPKAQTKPAIRERMQQALDPLSRALPVSPTDVSQTRAWLIQAGYRDAQHVTIYRGLRVLFVAEGAPEANPTFNTDEKQPAKTARSTATNAPVEGRTSFNLFC